MSLYEIRAFINDKGKWDFKKYLIVGFEYEHKHGGTRLVPLSMYYYSRWAIFDNETIHKGILLEDGTVVNQFDSTVYPTIEDFLADLPIIT